MKLNMSDSPQQGDFQLVGDAGGHTHLGFGKRSPLYLRVRYMGQDQYILGLLMRKFDQMSA